MNTLRLECYVGRENLHYKMAVARVSLSEEYAKHLLNLYDIWFQAHRRQAGLISLTWWDNSETVEWGDYNKEYELDYEWQPVEENEPDTWRECRVECVQIHVGQDGVYWSALPRHCDNRAETAEISWEQLREVEQGRCPFGQEVASRPEDPC